MLGAECRTEDTTDAARVTILLCFYCALLLILFGWTHQSSSLSFGMISMRLGPQFSVQARPHKVTDQKHVAS